jgi:hypothetical protein
VIGQAVTRQHIVAVRQDPIFPVATGVVGLRTISTYAMLKSQCQIAATLQRSHNGDSTAAL